MWFQLCIFCAIVPESTDSLLENIKTTDLHEIKNIKNLNKSKNIKLIKNINNKNANNEIYFHFNNNANFAKNKLHTAGWK